MINKRDIYLKNIGNTFSDNSKLIDLTNAHNININIFSMRIKTRKIFFKNKQIKQHTIFFILLILFATVCWYTFFKTYFENPILYTIIFFISILLYFISLIMYRWNLDLGTLKYEKEKIILFSKKQKEEIKYEKINKIERQENKISFSFFIYENENENPRIKFSFYSLEDVEDFEKILINKNIPVIEI